MCEWLSCREWCDVRLRCGGRSLPAHRAVLASVSTFLRQILLSCPIEESPTSIVLPDFDLEAMSSVLYYIYNGEVVIQKQKLEMFMEIVNAMQIFVDEQYLPSVCKGVGDAGVYSNDSSEKSKVFFLGDNESGPYINLRKGADIGALLAKHLHDDVDIRDKHVKCDEWSKQPHFGNVQSSCGDRQRSCFLRDLFIETYPRNGNANGRASGVLAIPSEHYRAAASVLLTNANGKHLAADDALSGLEKHTRAAEWPPNSHFLGQQIFLRDSNATTDNTSFTNYAELAQIKSLNLKNPFVDPILLSGSCDISTNSYLDRYLFQQTQILSTGLQEITKKPLNLKGIESSDFLRKYGASSPLLGKRKEEGCLQDYYNVSNSSTNPSTVLSKGAILNQVLESPWCPRQPNNYKPFRRKLRLSDAVPGDAKEDRINDSNNNIRTSPHREVTETISPNVPTQPLIPAVGLVGVSDFKCTICNQVFTDSATLAAHSRRHSSPGRYSCPECSKSFSQLRNFKYHMSIHRGTREFAATCTVCGKYFNDRGYLSSHMKIHRNRKEYKCSQCPKSFNQRVAYNMHVRIHTGIKPHVCGECGKAFSRKMLLKQHQRTHSGERPYACPHCEKRFADRSNMTLHLRLHTGVKPFSCTLCPKSFTKKHHLKSHLNFHTGAKPYSCPRCKLAFTQSSNMRTHMKKCTAPEPLSNAETPINI
ncbi:uncharacterized protein LOC126366728 isoform X2 [Pectinophora gossypiella]|nr:uncharacterized protein LOC126366728 isoform X2 [Pectinophora gossypiella]